MVDRLNNSTGVMGALKYLQAANTGLNSAESRLSSGVKIAKARDDAAAYQSAATMRTEQGSLKSVTLSLSRAQSVSDVSISAGEQVSKLLVNMRQTASAAMAGDLSQEQRQSYENSFRDQLAQLQTFVDSASFDKDNILNGTKPAGVSFVADSDATQSLSLKGRDFRPGQAVVTVGAGNSLMTATGAAQAYEMIGQSIANVGDQLQDMASENKRVVAQIGFVSKLADALADGVGRLVDTDLAAESALVQALQVKQELSAKSLGVANSAPEALLSLFRGS